MPALGASIIDKAYGQFSLAAEPSNCTSLPIAVFPLYNCIRPQLVADVFSTSPFTRICTGLPFVVIVVLTTVAGKDAVLSIVVFAPSVCE